MKKSDFVDLVIATGNKYKVQEMSSILSEYGVKLSQSEMKIIEPDYDTLEEIAEEKARQAFEKLKVPVIAEDTGVYFSGYNNFPGQLAKRVYLGLGFDGLLLLIKNSKNKRGYFATAVSYYDGKEMKTFSGKLNGVWLNYLVSAEADRLPYEKMFVPDGYEDAIVTIPIEEKNKISHRAKATRLLGEWLSKR